MRRRLAWPLAIVLAALVVWFFDRPNARDPARTPTPPPTPGSGLVGAPMEMRAAQGPVGSPAAAEATPPPVSRPPPSPEPLPPPERDADR